LNFIATLLEPYGEQRSYGRHDPSDAKVNIIFLQRQRLVDPSARFAATKMSDQRFFDIAPDFSAQIGSMARCCLPMSKLHLISEPQAERIVAVGLLTEQDLGVLGQGFRRAYRLQQDHDFHDLIAAIDRADIQQR
jgi:hypothetical protein